MSDNFLCPISKEIMKDPVILIATGNTYDRKSIMDWFNSCRMHNRPYTDPVFNTPVSSKEVIENWMIISMMSDAGYQIERRSRHEDIVPQVIPPCVQELNTLKQLHLDIFVHPRCHECDITVRSLEKIDNVEIINTIYSTSHPMFCSRRTGSVTYGPKTFSELIRDLS